MSETVFVSVVTGKYKKGEQKGQEWKAIKVQIGEWSQLIFPKTNFERKYIFNHLKEQGLYDGEV